MCGIELQDWVASASDRLDAWHANSTLINSNSLDNLMNPWISFERAGKPSNSLNYHSSLFVSKLRY